MTAATPPPEFLSAIEEAERDRRYVDLDLLCEDARGTTWRSQGLRLVARAQGSADSPDSALRSWRYLRELEPADMEAAIRIVEIENRLHERAAGSGRDTVPAALLFTGHRIDASGRSPARFPANAEVQVRSAIRRTVAEELEASQSGVIGFAGGANGGDILFHEVCAELGVATELFLAVPATDYLRLSVMSDDPSWAVRFERLVARVPTHTLAESAELPSWLRDDPSASLWQRANFWLLFHAIHRAGSEISLIALWDGEPGNGAGGTSDFLSVAHDEGVRTIVLDPCKIASENDGGTPRS